MIKYFYDTSTLLEYGEEIINKNEDLFICDIVLKELEEIKSSRNKDEGVKRAAQKVISLLNKNNEKMIYIHYAIERLYWVVDDFQLERNNDALILASLYIMQKEHSQDTFILYTNDLSMKSLGEYIMRLQVLEYIPKIKEKYEGVLSLSISDNDLAKFYQEQSNYAIDNCFNLLDNQYLILSGEDRENPSIYKWIFDNYEKIPYRTIETRMFGTIKPRDNYQRCAIDSLYSNTITVLTGPAGSGKSLLAMSYLWSLLERGNIDKIIIFANPIAAKGAAKLGYYPGSREDKLMDSQIGNFLIAKLGSQTEVDKMLDEGSLMLLPISDIRGMDTSGMNAGIYITEAQNFDINLMKLALQRIGEDCICILDGDTKSQVDSEVYSGINNGLARVIEVFKGQNFFGWVDLKQIYRSKIAQIAEKM